MTKRAEAALSVDPPPVERTRRARAMSGQREHDEDDLVDTILARGQAADQVGRPEDRVVREGEEGPAFPPPEGGHGDHGTEEAHANRRHTDGPQVLLVLSCALR